MKHNWQLECTIDEFVDMVIEDNPKVKHLVSVLMKLEDPLHDMGDISADEYGPLVTVLENEIHSIILSYRDNYKLYNLMNPHMRSICKRSASYLAPRLSITEISARQLKNTAHSHVYYMLSTAYKYLLFRDDHEIPIWIRKDIKKYFKEKQ